MSVSQSFQAVKYLCNLGKALNFLICSQNETNVFGKKRKIFIRFYSTYLFLFQAAYFPFLVFHSMPLLYWRCSRCCNNQSNREYPSFCCCCFNRTILYLILFLCDRKKVIIHVPYRVKNVKHVHTIYKIIPHYREDKKEDFEEDDKYEIY